MKRVLILQNKILHYRKPLYNKLAEKYDLTVLHSGAASIEDGDNYKEIIVPVKTRFKLKFQEGVIQEVKSGKYFAVVAMLDIHWINNLIASYVFPKSTKFIWWGIMVSSKKTGNKIRAKILKRGLPSIFYTEQGIRDMKQFGVNNSNATFCNNTIHIENRIKCYKEPVKSSILFVGSLDSRKRVDILISSFSFIQKSISENITLDIIGSGIEESNLKEQVKDLKLEDKILFHGQINKTNELESFYKKAICSVSFGQAGLAVLQSMGYGVPFITKQNAISGGEITNISHNENGFICENNPESLSKYLIKLCQDTSLSCKMGEKAYLHYSENCTIEKMADKFSYLLEK